MTRLPRVAVIWIDWYAYHLARFRALGEHPAFGGATVGIEMVGGTGVHTGFRFRDADRDRLPITTLAPEVDWDDISQWRLATLLWKRLNQERPSVVLVPGYYTLPALAAGVWGRLRRARTVLMSESTEADHPRHALRELVKRALIHGLFDYAIVGGTRHREYLQRLGFRGARIASRYDVVDNAFFRDGVRAIRSSTPPPPMAGLAPYFLYFGRLAPEKNLDLLLRAFADYVARGGEWKLVLAGDGSARRVLVAQSESLNLASRVLFAGHQTTKQLLEYYACAAAFVLPSLREPWGLVVNEAMAAGLPVIVSDACGAAADMVESGQNGFTFDPASQSELTARLLAISGLDDEARGAMARRSLEIVDDYSPTHWATEVARIAME
jgi:1,2-diacylglycerol 3-alpha-glucosyltransferase